VPEFNGEVSWVADVGDVFKDLDAPAVRKAEKLTRGSIEPEHPQWVEFAKGWRR